MNNKLIYSSKLLMLICLVSAFIVLPLDEGKFKVSFTLQDGERIISDSLFTKFNVNELDERVPMFNSQNVVLRSYDTDSNNINDLHLYVDYLLKEKTVDYWEIVPYGAVSEPYYAFDRKENSSSFEDKKIEGFQNYYRTLFKSKLVRNILFKSALEYVTVLCKKNPADFKQRVLLELEKLLKFSNTLKFLNYDGEISAFDNYWEGFIYRRHFIDYVTILEIQSLIIEATTKIKAIEITHKLDALYEININNQIAIYYSGKSSFIKSLSSLKKVYFNEDGNIKSIRYLKDITGDYYQIIFLVKDAEKRMLYNKDLDKIN